MQYLMALCAQIFHRRRRGYAADALASDGRHVVVLLRHAVHVFIQADLFIPKHGGVTSQQFINLSPVGEALMNFKF